jgi:hypothetical protein
VDRQRRDAACREVRRHELGVLDAHAKAERADAAQAGDAFVELREHQIGARLVARVELGERGGVVAGARPADAAQVGLIGEAEVVEGREELAIERVPQAQLGRDVAVEVG